MRSSERDKDPALFLEEQKNNLIIARDIMGLSKARLVYAKKGHGCNIEIVKEASELESKEGLFLVAGYIFESSSDMLSPSEMKDILYPLGEDEGLDDHYRKMRSEIFDYDGVAANLYWQAPDYSNSLDDISVAEKKLLLEWAIGLTLTP